MICSPKLVSTGLDQFANVQDGDNDNWIVCSQTGSKPSDMRQAARQSWWIGRPKDCTIEYLDCRETMQHPAMNLTTAPCLDASDISVSVR